MGTLTVKLFGATLNNPVMNASGTLGYGVEIEPLWGIETLGAYVTKGLSLKPHHGNPTPRVWEDRHGMINSIGLQNVGVDRFFEKYFPFFVRKKTPIIVNFFGFTEEEYLACAAAIPRHELIVALEMNLSCPNIKKGGISFGKEPSGVYDIVKKAKAVTGIPIIAKLTPEVKNIVEIGQAASEAGAAGLTLINTMPAAAIDQKSGRIALKGGLSGPVLRPIALRAVHDITRALSIPVIGVGGITDSRDVVAFLLAGATAVQVGTATFIDPYAIPKMIAGLNAYAEEHNLSCLEALVGNAHKE